jgi:hypothetical protein
LSQAFLPGPIYCSLGEKRKIIPLESIGNSTAEQYFSSL